LQSTIKEIGSDMKTTTLGRSELSDGDLAEIDKIISRRSTRS
jgi:hypothetical protein